MRPLPLIKFMFFLPKPMRMSTCMEAIPNSALYSQNLATVDIVLISIPFSLHAGTEGAFAGMGYSSKFEILALAILALLIDIWIEVLTDGPNVFGLEVGQKDCASAHDHYEHGAGHIDTAAHKSGVSANNAAQPKQLDGSNGVNFGGNGYKCRWSCGVVE